MATDLPASFYRLAVQNEMERLEATDAFPPIGGWRNRAIEHIAEREGMNPYTLDHIIRGIANRHVGS